MSPGLYTVSFDILSLVFIRSISIAFQARHLLFGVALQYLSVKHVGSCGRSHIAGCTLHSDAVYLQEDSSGDARDDGVSPGAEEVHAGGPAVPQTGLSQPRLLQLPLSGAIYNYLPLQWRRLVEDALAGDGVLGERGPAVTSVVWHTVTLRLWGGTYRM